MIYFVYISAQISLKSLAILNL